MEDEQHKHKYFMSSGCTCITHIHDDIAVKLNRLIKLEDMNKKLVKEHWEDWIKLSDASQEVFKMMLEISKFKDMTIWQFIKYRKQE